MLTNCQKWLTTCLQTVKKWFIINIQSILFIDYRKNQYNRTRIDQVTASKEFYSQREHKYRQTNRRRRWLFIYNKKNIIIYQNDLYYFHRWVLHTHSTIKQKQNIEPPPVAPRRQSTYTQSIRTDAQTRVSIFHVSNFWEREAD